MRKEDESIFLSVSGKEEWVSVWLCATEWGVGGRSG